MIKDMEFKGKGEHNINQLESMCLDYKEKTHQQQLKIQELESILQSVYMCSGQKGYLTKSILDEVKLAIDDK